MLKSMKLSKTGFEPRLAIDNMHRIISGLMRFVNSPHPALKNHFPAIFELAASHICLADNAALSSLSWLFCDCQSVAKYSCSTFSRAHGVFLRNFKLERILGSLLKQLRLIKFASPCHW